MASIKTRGSWLQPLVTATRKNTKPFAFPTYQTHFGLKLTFLLLTLISWLVSSTESTCFREATITAWAADFLGNSKQEPQRISHRKTGIRITE